ncbi:MAG: L,D-transpeptidase family protein, partial [Geminicoccaceae bacterium]
MCLVGVWFSSGCNLDSLLHADGRLSETASYRTAYEDTFVDLARQFNLGYVEIIAANPETDPWVPGDGTDIILPTVHLMPDLGDAEPEGIVINLADMRLYYFKKPGDAPVSFPIGIGRDGLLTPT